jgi:hypothetical protein
VVKLQYLLQVVLAAGFPFQGLFTMSQSHRGSNESTGSDCEGPGSDFLDAGKKGAPKRRGMKIRESEV